MDDISSAKKQDSGFYTSVLRFVLFIMCVFMVCDSVSKFQAFGLTKSELEDLDIPYFRIQFYHYIPIVLSGLLGLLGCYGALTMHVNPLRLFAFSVFGISLVSTALAFFAIKLRRMKKLRRNVIGQLEDYGHMYEYNFTPAQGPSKETRVWDELQSKLHCCGLEGPEDWPKWRRSTEVVKQDLYPDSCCMWLPRISNALDLPGLKCHEDMTYKSGCIEAYKTTIDMEAISLLLDLVVRVIMSFLAAKIVQSLRSNATICPPNTYTQLRN